MARDLSSSLLRVFREPNGRTGGCYYRGRSNIPFSAIRYMDISIKDDSIIIPVFALDEFIDLTRDNKDLSTDVITALLFTKGDIPYYKSLDRYMRDIIIEKFTHSRLVKCDVKQGSDIITYYCTHGAVFDSSFNPVMVCSWDIQRVWEDDEHRKYHFVSPIINISPECFINQSDPMQRWIVKKVASTGLNGLLEKPYSYNLTSAFEISEHKMFPLKVEICKSPFKIKATDTPSVSTTNNELLQLVINHIEEVVA